MAESTYGYGYDDAGRLTTLEHFKGGTTFAGYAWSYNGANQISTFTNSEYSGEDVWHHYDPSGQLRRSNRTSGSNENYVYDDNGNRITGNGDSYTTGTNNQMESDDVFDYTYDDEGNTLTKVRISGASVNDKTTEYTWDHRNRLTSVTLKNNAGTVTQKVEYTYDAFDRLIGREVDTDGDTDIDETQRFLYDGQHIALAFDENDAVTNRYLHGPAIDMVLADEQVGGDLLWALADNQGTIRDLVSYDAGTDTTTVENHRTFNSFGKITSETNAAVDHLFAYTGRILDEVTGDQNHRARWYDTDTGKWLSEDPIGFAGGDPNLARYVGNGPTNGTDPSGLTDVLEYIILYRGDRPGKTEFLSNAATINGFRASQQLIDLGDLQDMQSRHAAEPPKRGTPLISTTCDERVAEYFATRGNKRTGTVYTLKIPRTLALRNSNNIFSVGAGADGALVPENEYTVPNRIKSEWIVGSRTIHIGDKRALSPRLTLPSSLQNLPGNLRASGRAAAPLAPMFAEAAGCMLNDATKGQFEDEAGYSIGIMDRTIGQSPPHMLDNLISRTLGWDPFYFRKLLGDF